MYEKTTEIDSFTEMLAHAITRADFVDTDGDIIYAKQDKVVINNDQNIITVTLSNGNTYNLKVMNTKGT